MDIVIQNILSPFGITNIPNITLFISLVLAIIQCFFGFKVIRFWISILGFLLGAAGGYGVVFSITGNATYGLLGGIICALLLSVLAYRVYLSAVFVIAGIGAYYICMTCLPIDSNFLQVVSLTIAIIIAVVAMKYMRPAIICITAFQGALTAAEILPTFLSVSRSYVQIIGIVLGLAGILVQFFTTKK